MPKHILAEKLSLREFFYQVLIPKIDKQYRRYIQCEFWNEWAWECKRKIVKHSRAKWWVRWRRFLKWQQ